MFDRSSPLKHIYAIFLFALAVFAVTFVARRLFDSNGAVFNVQSATVVPGDLLSYERNTIEVFQKASPAVVFVHNLQYQRNLWSWNVSEVQQGTGSGFLWDANGHLVTNYHVVHGADRVAVTLIDGRTYEARIVGEEPRKDLAVLKIDLLNTNVEPFVEKIADSSKILVGQKAIAIGNPYGLDHTLTVGAISATGRSMSSIVESVTIRDMIQTDAAVNPGNSGGPLLDSSGRLLGMNTLILRNSTGIGFAVPSNTIKRLVEQIVKYGKPLQSGIGASYFTEQTSRWIRSRTGVDGLMVREVAPGSPAEQAGLRGARRDQYGRLILGDIVVSIDGENTRNYDDMYNVFDEKHPGEKVTVVFYRDGELRELAIDVVEVGY